MGSLYEGENVASVEFSLSATGPAAAARGGAGRAGAGNAGRLRVLDDADRLAAGGAHGGRGAGGIDLRGERGHGPDVRAAHLGDDVDHGGHVDVAGDRDVADGDVDEAVLSLGCGGGGAGGAGGGDRRRGAGGGRPLSWGAGNFLPSGRGGGLARGGPALA